MMRFKNAASQNHFIVMAKLKNGMTYQDFKKWLAAAMDGPPGPSPVKFLTGQRSREPGLLGDLHLQPAQGQLRRYALRFWPDAKMGGMPHVLMGMHRAITLK